MARVLRGFAPEPPVAFVILSEAKYLMLCSFGLTPLPYPLSLGEGKVFIKFRHTERSEVSQTNQEKAHICRTLQKQQNKPPSTFGERVAHFRQI